MKDEMLNKWAANLDDRMVIREFLEWAMDTKGDISLYNIHIEKVLNEYHGIDVKQLDKERRALLESAK